MTKRNIISVWRIATDTQDFTADDLSGEGAKLSGGRWNRRGNPVLYCAQNIALACLETIVHLGQEGLPLNRYLVRIDIPTQVWENRTILDPDAHVGWDALPVGKVSLDMGDAWLSRNNSLIMLVPSVIVPEESNILINPNHAGITRIKAVKMRKWTFDGRLA